jgi:hypothetical protein
MLSVPTPPDAQVEGFSDETPIVLQNINSKDFARLLWMFYNP